jgi:hypothetical protein
VRTLFWPSRQDQGRSQTLDQAQMSEIQERAGFLTSTSAAKPATKYDARNKLLEFRASGDAGTHIEPDKITVGEWIDQWLDAARPVGKSTKAQGQPANAGAIRTIATDARQARRIDRQRSLLDANDASSRRRQVVAAPTCRPSRASGSRPWMIRHNFLVGAPARRFP